MRRATFGVLGGAAIVSGLAIMALSARPDAARPTPTQALTAGSDRAAETETGIDLPRHAPAVIDHADAHEIDAKPVPPGEITQLAAGSARIEECAPGQAHFAEAEPLPIQSPLPSATAGAKLAPDPTTASPRIETPAPSTTMLAIAAPDPIPAPRAVEIQPLREALAAEPEGVSPRPRVAAEPAAREVEPVPLVTRPALQRNTIPQPPRRPATPVRPIATAPQREAKIRPVVSDLDQARTVAATLIVPKESSLPTVDAPTRTGAGATKPMMVWQLLSKGLRDEHGNDLGEVVRVVRSEDGRTRLVVGRGGLIDFAGRRVAVPLDRIALRGDGLVVRGLTRDQFRAMPEWHSDADQLISRNQVIGVSGGY